MKSLDIELQFRELIEKTIAGKKDRKMVFSALEFAKKAHNGQKRQSGEEYIIHPVAIALSLHKKYGDLVLTTAALLHDSVEDCPLVNMKKIYQKFGKEIGFLVDANTKTILSYYNFKKIFKDKLEKTLWAGMRDVRAIILKLADREFNLSDLENLVPNKQIRMSFETQAIYFPLKKILMIDKKKSLSELESDFKKFLKDKKLRNEKELKEFLFNICFNNLTNKAYDIIYGNSDKIIWLVEDRKFYARLCEDRGFEKSIDQVDFWTDGNDFKAMINFKKGAVFSDKNVSFSLAGYKA